MRYGRGEWGSIDQQSHIGVSWAVRAHTGTLNTQPHSEQHPPKRSKLAEQLLHIKHMRTNHTKSIGKERTHSVCTAHPISVWYNVGWGVGLNSQILSKEQRVWIPQLSVPTPTFKTPTREMGSPSTEGQWGAYLWTHKISANREAIF